MGDRFATLCREIGEAALVSIRYAGTVEFAADHAELVSELTAAFEAKRSLDLRRGLTHVGPHRDDLTITITGVDGTARELRTFGSAGQQRSAAIALRMLEASTFTERTGRSPVFLLDDPFAELDVRRAARVLDLLAGNELGQTVLVVPRDNDIPTEFTGLERFRIAAGELVRFSV
jgi:DNA replication and repair protein RecF